MTESKAKTAIESAQFAQQLDAALAAKDSGALAKLGEFDLSKAQRKELGRAVHRPVRVIPLPSPLTWAAAAASEAWARLRGTTPELSLDKAREATAGSWACSGAKARDGLRIKLRTSMDERLAQTARWYQDQGWFDR